MKLLVPLAIALLGLGAGVGAGLALKPAPVEEPAAAEGGHAACTEEPGKSCPPEGEAAAADPFKPVAKPAEKPAGELAYVAIEKPFVVPIFHAEKIAAMVVISLSVETEKESETPVKDAEPRLRDAFLKVMFRHANSGGFDGSFTIGQKIEDLKSALLSAAHEVLPEAPIREVLITEIARQDV